MKWLAGLFIYDMAGPTGYEIGVHQEFKDLFDELVRAVPIAKVRDELKNIHQYIAVSGETVESYKGTLADQYEEQYESDALRTFFGSDAIHDLPRQLIPEENELPVNPSLKVHLRQIGKLYQRVMEFTKQADPFTLPISLSTFELDKFPIWPSISVGLGDRNEWSLSSKFIINNEPPMLDVEQEDKSEFVQSLKQRGINLVDVTDVENPFMDKWNRNKTVYRLKSNGLFYNLTFLHLPKPDGDALAQHRFVYLEMENPLDLGSQARFERDLTIFAQVQREITGAFVDFMQVLDDLGKNSQVFMGPNLTYSKDLTNLKRLYLEEASRTNKRMG